MGIVDSYDSHLCDCGTHYTCQGENPADHLLCSICSGGYICEGGHGISEGECGYEPLPSESVAWEFCSACDSYYVAGTEVHQADCWNHYICQGENPADHVLCSICSGGYICEGGHGTSEGECGYAAPSPDASPSGSEDAAASASSGTDTASAALVYAKRNAAAQLSFPLSGLAIASLAFLLPCKRRKED